jgi:hypothetical protein
MPACGNEEQVSGQDYTTQKRSPTPRHRSRSPPPSLHFTVRSRSFQPIPVEGVPPRSNTPVTSDGHSESAERFTSRHSKPPCPLPSAFLGDASPSRKTAPPSCPRRLALPRVLPWQLSYATAPLRFLVCPLIRAPLPLARADSPNAPFRSGSETSKRAGSNSDRHASCKRP